MARSGRGSERGTEGEFPHTQGSGRAGRGRGRGGRASSGVGRAGARDAAGQKPRRPLLDLIDYLKTCVKTVEAGMSSRDEEEMMASRALEEMGDRILLVAADQRGSRPLEKLLRRASCEGFAEAFKHLMEALPDLAPNQYASHVLEVAFSSWAERQRLETAAADGSVPSSEPLVRLCDRLREDGLYNVLAHDACASHTIRALVLALAGYAPLSQSKDQAAARAGLLPERRFRVPAEVAECRRAAGRVYCDLLRDDDNFCLSAHASPVVQLVLRVLRACSDTALHAEVAAAVVQTESATISAQRCDALLQSAAGSRALEAVIETANASLFQELFTRYFRQRLSALVRGDSGEFGAFVAARIVDGLRDEPQLKLVFAGMDFQACLQAESTPAQQAVVSKLAEACLRLRAGHRHCATEIFSALGLRSPTEHHRAWPTLMALSQTESLVDLLRVKRVPKEADDLGGTPKPDNSTPVAAQPPALLKALPAAGPQLLGALLRFPGDAVQPLNGGLPPLLKCAEGLGAMARNRATARVLEAAVAPASALQPKLRLKLAAAFKGLLAGLGPHPIGGWVCAAIWRASLGHTSLREEFAKELLTVEDELRSDNYAVWKVCGLNQLKLRQGEWEQQQQKAGKTKRVFEELLEGPTSADVAAAPQKKKVKSGKQPKDDNDDGEDKESLAMDEMMDEMLGRKAEQSEVQPLKDVANTKPPSDDAALKETLQLIAGKAPSARKRKKRAAKAAAAAAAEKDADSD